jgi:hypothetical protein
VPHDRLGDFANGFDFREDAFGKTAAKGFFERVGDLQTLERIEA